ncbi:hypothetical protein ACFPOD_15955 [Nitratireductor kimnyeongensis]|uniref:Uncharacterized protein n=1 Tax=Nitratireductor kimnyeongensis TaxID=430679 RepID=A0ABW0TDW0_9HYPH|nr:hypothetical protein [Nitratireductor kimnyeongensis]QZZ36884.1 hypothetical protein KW403_07095 [Nitratireductor kimnyeongensis]
MAIQLKDRMRDIRDFLRSHRHERQATTAAGRHFGDMESVLGRAASMIDDTLNLAETASRSVLSATQKHELVLWPLSDYFGDQESGERAFRRHMYRAARTLARTLEADAEPPVIREAGFTAAHEALRRRQGSMVLALKNAAEPEKKHALIAGMLAHLIQEICHSALSDQAAPPSRQASKACILVFAPGLLTSALMAFGESLPVSDLFDIATLAISARQDRMAHSLGADQPISDLAAIFEALLIHLP